MDFYSLINSKDIREYLFGREYQFTTLEAAWLVYACRRLSYVEKKEYWKVSNLYIAQVKKKCGLELGENFNLPKSENAKPPQCPEEKERAIVEALKHFKMVQ